jgi:hydroxymethylpyrimidine/phosphomethylpyrimidine kinase
MPRLPDTPLALSIAGSDSGGGAGIQADLRVFHRLGAFGTTAITAITAQNLAGVRAVAGQTPAVVVQQIDAVLEGFTIGAVKTGMLWSAAIVTAVAERLARARLPVVVDPVMVATSGARLLGEDAIAAYCERLLPNAAVITPNLDEAAVLLDRGPIRRDELAAVAGSLHLRFGVPVLLKGGHLDGDPVDLLRDADGAVAWRHARVTGVNAHGTGCMLSAAIAARLAAGAALRPACAAGLAFVHDALQKAQRIAPGVALAGIEAAVADPAALVSVDVDG